MTVSPPHLNVQSAAHWEAAVPSKGAAQQVIQRAAGAAA